MELVESAVEWLRNLSARGGQQRLGGIPPGNIAAGIGVQPEEKDGVQD
jgi:hypothetical protein